MANKKLKKVYIAKFTSPAYGDLFFKVGVSTEPRRRVRRLLVAFNTFLSPATKVEVSELHTISVCGDSRAYEVESMIKRTLKNLRIFEYEPYKGFEGFTECFPSSHFIFAKRFLDTSELSHLVFTGTTSSMARNLNNLKSIKTLGLPWGSTRVALNSEQHNKGA